MHGFVADKDSLENQLEDMISQYGSGACCVDLNTGCDSYTGVTLGYALDRTSECYFSIYNTFGGGNYFPYIDKTQGFVPSEYEYRLSNISSDNYSMDFVCGIRNIVYLNYYSSSSNIWVEYVLPSRKPIAGYNQFKVYIETTHQKSDDTITGMSFIIQNDGIIANGGYVEQSGGTLVPAEDTDEFNNEVFTDQNLIVQANNDVIVTPSTVDPVSTVTGNMYHDETDVVIKGKGLDMVFTRTYNSGMADKDTTEYPLSKGWTHSYNMQLTANDYTKTPNEAIGAPTTGTNFAKLKTLFSPAFVIILRLIILLIFFITSRVMFFWTAFLVYSCPILMLIFLRAFTPALPPITKRMSVAVSSS